MVDMDRMKLEYVYYVSLYALYLFSLFLCFDSYSSLPIYMPPPPLFLLMYCTLVLALSLFCPPSLTQLVQPATPDP